MQYRHANGDVLTHLRDINRVLRNAPGFTALPPRLVAELAGRAKEHLERPVRSLLDPCCGGAGTLVILGMLLSDELDRIGAGDVSAQALALAQKNLALLTEQGLEERENEFGLLVEQFRKIVHQEALSSIRALRAQFRARQKLTIDIRQADISASGALTQAFDPAPYDLVFTDLPYGGRVEWQSSNADMADMVSALLTACHDLVITGGVVVAVAPRRMRAKIMDGFQSLGRSRAPGGREIHFFRKLA